MLIFRIDQDKEIGILIIKGIHNKLHIYMLNKDSIPPETAVL